MYSQNKKQQQVLVFLCKPPVALYLLLHHKIDHDFTTRTCLTMVCAVLIQSSQKLVEEAARKQEAGGKCTDLSSVPQLVMRLCLLQLLPCVDVLPLVFGVIF